MGLFECCEGYDALAPIQTGARRHEPYLWDCLPRVFRTPPPRRAALREAIDQAGTPVGGHLYFIRFNYHVEFLHSPFSVPDGSLVVVEGERGVDVGIAMAPGSTDLIPVQRPGLKKGESCYRTCLGLAPPEFRAARGRANRLAHQVMLALRQRTEYLGRRYHFLGVEVQADLQHAVVFHRSHPDEPILHRDELVPRLFAVFHMRFWFEDVAYTPGRVPRADESSPEDLDRTLPSPTPSPPCTNEDCGSEFEPDAEYDGEVVLCPLPV